MTSCLLDSGYLYAQVNGKDSPHPSVSAVNLGPADIIILPVPAITEVTYLLQRDLGRGAVINFIRTLTETNIQIIAPSSEDYLRSAEILRKYDDSNIDFVDACIVAMAERLDIRTILTTTAVILVFSNQYIVTRSRYCLNKYENNDAQADALDRRP